MPNKTISDALTGIESEHIHIDSLGRAVITNPELVSKLAEAGVKARPDLGSSAAGNIICTGSMPAGSREVLEGIRNLPHS
jgi:hypothetical protein